MKAIILGAGPGFEGIDPRRSHPTAIHEVSSGRRTLDFLIEAFRSAGVENFIFVGGYRIEQIIKLYPMLHYYYNPDWPQSSSLASLRLCEAELAGPVLISYADALYAPAIVKKLAAAAGPVSVLEDQEWMERYEGRGPDLIEGAEKIAARDSRVMGIGRRARSGLAFTGQFAGLIKLNDQGAARVRAHLARLSQRAAAEPFQEAPTLGMAGLTDLLQDLIDHDVPVESVPVRGQWAELDAPQDVAQFVFGTKAETLERLKARLKKSTVADQVRFTVGEWMADAKACLDHIQRSLASARLVVRSSALSEDGWASSQAGRYASVVDVPARDPAAIAAAVEEVIRSYGDGNANHQCLVQPALQDVVMAGVVFTRDPETAAPYYIVNYECTGRTDGITSGAARAAPTLVAYRATAARVRDPDLARLLECVGEVEAVVGYDSLDVEFAITRDGRVHVLQVRPLVANRKLQHFTDQDVAEELVRLEEQVALASRPGPLLLGSRSVLGVMPDWNPAEMVGRTPRPLALSLYQYLITDEIWGIQRAEYGYRDTFPTPLILGLAGQGFVDTRASFNSFVPAELPDALAGRLIDHYLRRLTAHPELHDKVEFEIAFTCYSFDFDQRADRLRADGFSAADIQSLKQALQRLTRRALTSGPKWFDGWQDRIARLGDRRARFTAGEGGWPELARSIQHLLEDARRYGTLPFAHFARSAFLATDLVRSLVREDALSPDEYHAWLASIETVAGRFARDAEKLGAGELSLKSFLDRYGHLRPGTYDILSFRYDEKPELYFSASPKPAHDALPPPAPFGFSGRTRDRLNRLLREGELEVDADGFAAFVRRAIQGREHAKFEFTKNVSQALVFIGRLAEKLGFSREDFSFLPVREVLKWANQSGGCSLRTELEQTLDTYRARHRLTRAVKLPHLVASPEDVRNFFLGESQPNFITQKKVTAPLISITEEYRGEHIDGRIVHIANADPGFDWIFGRPLAGLMTTYGGANSHMAIRAAEFGLPAAIGCGELWANRLRSGMVVELNCLSGQIQVVG